MINKVVVDASVAIKWFIPEDDSEFAIALAASKSHLLAPDFLLIECANTTWKKVQRQQVNYHQALVIIQALNKLPLTFSGAYNLLDAAYELAVEIKQSVYDCLYLALAIANDSYVVTADKRFYNAVSKSSFRNYVQLLGK